MKTYLVIGAGAGMSFATAEKFASQGYNIVLAARNYERLNILANRLKNKNYSVETAVVDSSNPSDVAALIQKYKSSLSVIHFNTGVFHFSPEGQLLNRTLDDEDETSLEYETNANITSGLVAIKTATEIFKEKGEGTILITGGGFGVEPSNDFLNISIAKSALRAATKALFEPLKALNIHIAILTIYQYVTPESPESKKVADEFWGFHTEEKEQWSWEKTF